MRRAVSTIVLICATVLAFAQTTQPASPVSAYQISGTVVNAVTGAKIAGAKVIIANAARRAQMRETLTSATGQFLFDNVAQGKYAMAMSARGFQQQGFEQHEEYASAIAVGPGKRSTGIVFRAQPDAVIMGQITGAFSEPVRDGQVYLIREAIENGKQVTRLAQTANSDDEGVYRFKHLAAGRYHVAVTATPWFAQYGYQAPPANTQLTAPDQAAQEQTEALLDEAYAVTYFGDTTDPGTSSVVTARSGETTVANVNLTPVRAARISVKTDGNTDRRMARSFMAHQVGVGGMDMPVNTSQVGGNGVMELRGLPPGHYKVDIQTYQEASGTTKSSRELDVSGESQELDESDPASHSVTVSGRVVLDAGVPAPSAGMVLLQNSRTRRGHSAQLNAQGEFTFEEPVEPGTYQVFVANVRGAQLRSINATGATVTGRDILIGSDAAEVKLTIVASRGLGTVNGTAMTGDAPFAGAMIALVPQDPVGQSFLMRRDQSDSDGTFTLAQVVPGRYTVIALKNGWEMEWNSPEAIRGYLARGTSVVVAATSKLDVRVEVQ